MSDEVDEVLGYPVHVSGVVLECGGGGEGRGEAGAEEVPVLTVLVHHPDVVVVLRTQVAVDNIRLIRWSQWVFGGCPQDGFNILQCEG